MVAGAVPDVVAGFVPGVEVWGVVWGVAVVGGVGDVVVVDPIGVVGAAVVPGEHDADALSPPEHATVEDLWPNAKKMTRPPTTTTTMTMAAMAPWLSLLWGLPGPPGPPGNP